MGYVMVTECRVPMERMQLFTQLVQQWEQDVLDTEDAPELHAVYLREEDPSQVLIVTQFASRDEAERFAASGRMEQFRQHVLRCTAEAPSAPDGYTLFYAAGRDGTRVVFGEES
jgi:hypothetical protein